MNNSLQSQLPARSSVLTYKMRRPAAVLILLLLTSCRFYDTGKRVVAAAVIHSFQQMQAHAPLTQSVARPVAATPDRASRLIAACARRNSTSVQ
ncbi:MAG: hypothetical protein DMF59_12865 [Acidobacteria bacterium]|nr:MAG: hypothetical protein DMF59_12865 [Acidobacteriota bacterium]